VAQYRPTESLRLAILSSAYISWTTEHKRPSTAKGYRDIWEDHLKPHCAVVWLKDARTYHVQSWLNQIGVGKLSRNTLKHVKSVVSGIFTLAKQQDYFQGERTPPAIPPSTQRQQDRRKPMLTLWKRFRRSFPCSLNPQRRLLQSRRSWDYDTARFKVRSGKTTVTTRCTLADQSGMVASRTQKPTKAVLLFR
jgi:hypothetical protein